MVIWEMTLTWPYILGRSICPAVEESGHHRGAPPQTLNISYVSQCWAGVGSTLKLACETASGLPLHAVSYKYAITTKAVTQNRRRLQHPGFKRPVNWFQWQKTKETIKSSFRHDFCSVDRRTILGSCSVSLHFFAQEQLAMVRCRSEETQDRSLRYLPVVKWNHAPQNSSIEVIETLICISVYIWYLLNV